MSDSSIGDIVDANAEANAAAAVEETLGGIPDTTVVVEDTANVTDPALALDYSAQVRQIAREEADNQILGWIAIAEANAPPEPEVVVVPTPAPEPEPMPMPEPMPEPESEPDEDEAPPRDHWYFRKPGRKS